MSTAEAEELVAEVIAEAEAVEAEAEAGTEELIAEAEAEADTCTRPEARPVARKGAERVRAAASSARVSP